MHLRYHYASTGWFAVGCLTLGAFGLLGAGFALAGLDSMRRRGPSVTMLAIVGVMALMAGAFIGSAAWYWTKVRALDRERDTYGITLESGVLVSRDWDPWRVREVRVQLDQITSAVQGSYKGRPFVRIVTADGQRVALPANRLSGDDIRRLRAALGIDTLATPR